MRLEAVKNWGPGEWKMGIWEGRFGVLKFEISLRSEEEDDVEDDLRYGDGERNGGSSPSIFLCPNFSSFLARV